MLPERACHIRNNTEPYSKAVHKTLWGVELVLLSGLIICSLVGNSITFVVLNKAGPLFRKSTNLYLSALALVDFCYTIVSMLSRFIDITFRKWLPCEYNLRRLSVEFCKLHSCLTYTLATFSVWLIVSVTIDRMIWIVLPFRAKKICTSRTGWKVIIACGVFSFCVHLQYLFTMQLTDAGCISNSTTVILTVDTIVTGALPILIMAVANILIWHTLRHMSLINSANSVHPLRSERSTAREKHPIHKTRKNASPEQQAEPVDVTVGGVYCGAVEQAPRFRQQKQDLQQLQQQANTSITNQELITFHYTDSSPEGLTKPRSVSRSKEVAEFSIARGTTRTPRASNILAMLFSVHAIFIITVIPMFIHLFCTMTQSYQQALSPNLKYSIQIFVYAFWHSNFAIHFILYCMTGPRFRNKTVSVVIDSVQRVRCPRRGKLFIF